MVSYALDLAGYHGVSRKFFEFCRNIITHGKESDGFFLHKYNPDGSLGSSWHPWIGAHSRGREGIEMFPFGMSHYKWLKDSGKNLPIQEDGTGLVIWALWEHFTRYRDIEFAVRHYKDMVLRCGDFLESYRHPETGLPLPSYDLWEEKRGIFTFSVSAVFAGLKAAGRFASFFGNTEKSGLNERAAAEVKAALEKNLYSREQGRFIKGIIEDNEGRLVSDMSIDASLYAPFYFDLFEPWDQKVVGTMNAIRERLSIHTDTGGLARYEQDAYQSVAGSSADVPGNPWLITTLWFAQWQIAKARTISDLDEALSILEWTASRALPSGVLAEQLKPYTSQPLSVSPLTWSHAAYVAAVMEYLGKLHVLRG